MYCLQQRYILLSFSDKTFHLLIQFHKTAFTLQVYRILPLLETVKYIQRGGDLMDVLERLQTLLDARGWTMYHLSKKSGLSESTIANIYRRNAVPSIVTLEYICKGFGITLSQFFAEGEMVELTPELSKVFENWRTLTPEQKEAMLTMMEAFNHDKQ